MNKVALYPENIGKILKDNIKDINNIFVFPTDIVLRSWIDYLINPINKTGVDAVPLEQFTAWDNFKKDFVSAKIEGETVIPTILRKMFVTSFIAKNASLPKEDRLQVIINPDDNFANEADSFSDWISKNLKTLHFWKKRIDEKGSEYGELDDEDKDYEKLYNAYSSFLKENKLFEPAWVDDISFSENDKTFHIFYPELLEDFTDYKDIFSNVPNITVYTLPNDIPSPKAYFYNDSRSELRQTILSIIELVNSGKADWSEIVLSVPNLEVYRPYIDREFSLYGIPYVIKAGNTLTRNTAGRLFREIYNCYNDNFSFNSVRTLLLDKCVPWKDKYNSDIENLIREGSEMRCICPIGDTDIWRKALDKRRSSSEYAYKNSEKEEDKERTKIRYEYYNNLLIFYNTFKKNINAFFNSEYNTFKNINKAWMQFKNYYLKDTKEFSEDANNIISRCITELNEIIQIEEKYKDCNLLIPSPYTFFLSELDKKTYTKQTTDKGLTVFPYRLSSAAAFKYQFVIYASQKNLDISYKRLTFLNNTKRSKLGLVDDDKVCNAGEAFIKLYAKNTTGMDESIVHFSASENTFNGFAIPHSKLIVDENTPNLDAKDYILKEKKYLEDPYNNEKVTILTQGQKDSYEMWKKSKIEADNKTPFSSTLKNSINNALVNRYNCPIEDNNIKFTARTDFEKFFPCPRKWLLLTGLKLREETLDTRLMSSYDMGNVNHKILELFMSEFKNKTLPYYENGSFYLEDTPKGKIGAEKIPYDNEIKDLLYGEKDIVAKAISSCSDIKNSLIVVQTLISQKKQIADNIYAFLCVLLKKYQSKITKGMVSSMTGIGNCIALECEKPLLASTDEDYEYFGIIDFFVKTPDDQIIIVDYKNSDYAYPKSSELGEDNTLGDFQMPLYYKLINANYVNGERIEGIASGAFYGIKKDSRPKFIADKAAEAYNEENDKGSSVDPELVNSQKALDEYAKLFIDCINTNNFNPIQTFGKTDKMSVKSYKDCATCSLKAICRTTFSVAGKTIKKVLPTNAKKEGVKDNE